MIKFLPYIMLAVACPMFYGFGHNAASLDYQERQLVQAKEIAGNYQKRIDELNILNEQLKDEVQGHIKDIRTLNHRADSLRMQLRKSSAASCPAGRPGIAGELSDGRPGALGKIVEGATDIIRERDEIALSYNRLKTQCVLK